MAKVLKRLGTCSASCEFEITFHFIEWVLNNDNNIKFVWKRSEFYVGKKVR